MPTPYVAALLLGVVAGLRTFTAPAALSLWRHFGPLGYALGALAVLEYVGDLHPRTPPRTGTLGLLARCASGAFCGWGVTTAHDASAATGVALGVAGALIGAYGGLAFRGRAIALVGWIPAAILEDGIAIAAAILVLKNAPA